MTSCLLDTGPLVAYLDAGDPGHKACADALDDFEGRLLTTSAVVVEAMHLLGEAREGPQALVKFLTRTHTQIDECADLQMLERAAGLMRKYQDLPMDFADATLVLLAHEAAVTDVFTLDRRGFMTYRTSTGKRFSIHPRI